MMITFVQRIYQVVEESGDTNALCISDSYTSYREFRNSIARIRHIIRTNIPQELDKIGLLTNDDVATYASILALWMEGKAYVPVNPIYPAERNSEILKRAECSFLLSSTPPDQLEAEYTFLWTDNPEHMLELHDAPQPINGHELAYILFTSGSTGTPKGVPINFTNLQALVEAIDREPEFQLKPSDRCLQLFELTFDFSLVTFVFPFLAGACIYTIPKDKLKYLHTYYLMQKYDLTVLTMVPSIIEQLRPYFREINVPSVRYCSFGGGKLLAGVASEWQDCIPHAKIFNYYGPTEFTVYSGFYPYHKGIAKKELNGAIAIGKPQFGVTYRLVNELNQPVQRGKVGELCLAGLQTTSGYWQDEEKNNTSFFIEDKAPYQRFYKTGDLCLEDEDGDYLFYGRADFQVKVNGYRVELGEIEHQISAFVPHCSNVVIDHQLENGHTALCGFFESDPFDTQSLTKFLRNKLPAYMVPGNFIFLQKFPLSVNGKINRKELRNLTTK